jgi:predicted ATPase
MNIEDRYKLTEISVIGYKSIGELQTLNLGGVNVLIGANGAGKSNLVSFFQMLNHVATNRLQLFIGRNGYADSMLYFGTKRSEHLKVKISCESQESSIGYSFVLGHAYQGQMIFIDEAIEYVSKGQQYRLGAGQQESSLKEYSNRLPEVQALLVLLEGCRVFQFHDTSANAPIRQPVDINDSRSLRSDAGNLAAFLYAMRESERGRKYYDRIESSIQRVMPQFEAFFLEPAVENPNYIKLAWKSQSEDYIFGAHQLSDGSLRFMALTALLLQPPENLPRVIVIDEPELGLHPKALMDLVGMIEIASENSQIILSTQSSFLLNFFDVDDVIVVDVENDSTMYKRLDKVELAQWVRGYSLAELWEKNILGGRP